MMLRDSVVPYHPGDYTPTDILARVAFHYPDKDELIKMRQHAREIEPRVYKDNGDVYGQLKDLLIKLPERVAKLKPDELPPFLKQLLDAGSLALLQEYATPPQNEKYVIQVNQYLDELARINPIVLPEDQRHEELSVSLNRTIVIPSQSTTPIRADAVYSNQQLEELRGRLLGLARGHFIADTLAPKIVALTIDTFKNNPTQTLDVLKTAERQDQAAQAIMAADADILYEPKQTIVPKGDVSLKGWQLLRAENDAYLSEDGNIWKSRAGTAASVILLTLVLATYTAKYQPRVIRNQARGIAVTGLLFSMLVIAQLAGVGSSPTYVFGIAPTIVVAMILTIAYDQRFATGIATIHAALVTLALNQSLSFFLVLFTGVLICCFLLNDIRTRSKLIEVGGVTAVVLILASCAASFVQLYPIQFMFRNALYAGAAGLGVGFVVLGILPFIEKAFRITTSMTLLELADVSHPLLRRLSLEAAGTYNHSLQVATLSEEAAEAIGADSLLCRVGAYYHDIGKINKPGYFVENQAGGENRHLTLNPNVSKMIIIGHVKDGWAMAKEYNLPTKLLPFIEQHHGTTLVEFFYHRACDSVPTDGPKISEDHFRYPGPKPKSKEIAILMLADCVESAMRTMTEPTSARIETLVHELAMKRLMDGQFDECDLTMRDLERIQRSLAKTLQSFYHGRIPYPSTRGMTSATGDSSTSSTSSSSAATKSA
ncbi:MAG TPA: HDIG domain-containing protein [Tepidisphaeraceae bacterium]|nr:HDIG domain-containing protein [Tepidisphaeraceae bacterium]